MSNTPLLLSDLIEESKKSIHEDSEDTKNSEGILFQFVHAAYPPYDITGCESEALALLINFSVRRNNASNPLDLECAENHLNEDNCRLIKRYYKSLHGIHTHNIKFPLSYLKGNIRSKQTYDDTDPYVHSRSIKPEKKWGYSHNAAYIKAQKAICSEFYYEGRLTCIFEEIRNNNSLGHQFVMLLTNAVDRSEGKDEDEDEDERLDKLVESAILQISLEQYPELATDPQIFSLRKSNSEKDVLLSPVVSTALQRSLIIRLKNCPYWMKTHQWVGTGLDKNTYGDLISDNGGFLSVFLSKPPVELQSKFGLLIERLEAIGHLYQFDLLCPDFLYYFTAKVNSNTGEQKRITTYKQNQIVDKECRLMVHSVFRDYKSLNQYRSYGKKIPGENENFSCYSPAQAFLITGNTRKSETVKTILDEVMPLLNTKIEQLAAEKQLPFTSHHQRAFIDAIKKYLLKT